MDLEKDSLKIRDLVSNAHLTPELNLEILNVLLTLVTQIKLCLIWEHVKHVHLTLNQMLIGSSATLLLIVVQDRLKREDNALIASHSREPKAKIPSVLQMLAQRPKSLYKMALVVDAQGLHQCLQIRENVKLKTVQVDRF